MVAIDLLYILTGVSGATAILLSSLIVILRRTRVRSKVEEPLKTARMSKARLEKLPPIMASRSGEKEAIEGFSITPLYLRVFQDLSRATRGEGLSGLL